MRPARRSSWPRPNASSGSRSPSCGGFDRNARVHSAKQVGQLAANIRQFGFVNPIIADAGNVVVAYNVRVADIGGQGKVVHPEFAMASGEMSREAFVAFLRIVLGNMAAVSQDGAIHFVFMDWGHAHEQLDAGHQVYAELKNICVWTKTNAGMGSFYRSQHELVFAWKHGRAPHINNFKLGETGRWRSNLWTYAGLNAFRRGRAEELASHPTVKPVALVMDALRDCSKRGGIVLDAFGGSGTTLIAAHRTGRVARLLEIDPLYVDVIIRRWEALTGERARHVESGQTFAERTTAASVLKSVEAEP